MGSIFQSVGLEQSDPKKTANQMSNERESTIVHLLAASGYASASIDSASTLAYSQTADVKPFFKAASDSSMSAVRAAESVSIGTQPPIIRSAVMGNLLSAEPGTLKAQLAPADANCRNLTQCDVATPHPTAAGQPEVPIMRVLKETAQVAVSAVQATEILNNGTGNNTSVRTDSTRTEMPPIRTEVQPPVAQVPAQTEIGPANSQTLIRVAYVQPSQTPVRAETVPSGQQIPVPTDAQPAGQQYSRRADSLPQGQPLAQQIPGRADLQQPPGQLVSGRTDSIPQGLQVPGRAESQQPPAQLISGRTDALPQGQPIPGRGDLQPLGQQNPGRADSLPLGQQQNLRVQSTDNQPPQTQVRGDTQLAGSQTPTRFETQTPQIQNASLQLQGGQTQLRIESQTGGTQQVMRSDATTPFFTSTKFDTPPVNYQQRSDTPGLPRTETSVSTPGTTATASANMRIEPGTQTLRDALPTKDTPSAPAQPTIVRSALIAMAESAPLTANNVLNAANSSSAQLNQYNCDQVRVNSSVHSSDRPVSTAQTATPDTLRPNSATPGTDRSGTLPTADQSALLRANQNEVAPPPRPGQPGTPDAILPNRSGQLNLADVSATARPGATDNQQSVRPLSTAEAQTLARANSTDPSKQGPNVTDLTPGRVSPTEIKPTGDTRGSDNARFPGDLRTPDSTRNASDPRTADTSRALGDPRTPDTSRALGDPRTPDTSRALGDPRTPDNARASVDTRTTDGSRAPGELRTPENSRVTGDQRSPENSRVPGDPRTAESSRLPGDPRTPESSRLPGDPRAPESSRLPGDPRAPESSRLPGDRTAENSKVAGEPRTPESSRVGVEGRTQDPSRNIGERGPESNRNTIEGRQQDGIRPTLDGRSQEGARPNLDGRQSEINKPGMEGRSQDGSRPIQESRSVENQRTNEVRAEGFRTQSEGRQQDRGGDTRSDNSFNKSGELRAEGAGGRVSERNDNATRSAEQRGENFANRSDRAESSANRGSERSENFASRGEQRGENTGFRNEQRTEGGNSRSSEVRTESQASRSSESTRAGETSVTRTGDSRLDLSTNRTSENPVVKVDSGSVRIDNQSARVDNSAVVRSENTGTRNESTGGRSEATGNRNEATGNRIEATGNRSENTATRSENIASRSESSASRSDNSGSRVEGIRTESATFRGEISGTRSENTNIRSDIQANRPTDVAPGRSDSTVTRADAQSIRPTDGSVDSKPIEPKAIDSTVTPGKQNDSANVRIDGIKFADAPDASRLTDRAGFVIDGYKPTPFAFPTDIVATQKEAAALRQVLNDLKQNQNLSPSEVLELPSFKEAMRLLEALKPKEGDANQDIKQHFTTQFVEAMRLSDFLKVLEKTSEVEQKRIHKQQWAARSLAQTQHRVRYLVQREDTLESIAQKILGDVRFVQLLVTINRAEIIFAVVNGKSVSTVYEGQYLWIPTPNEVEIHRKHYFSSNAAAVRGEPIAPEAETPILVEEYEAPTTVREFATRLRPVTAPPVMTPQGPISSPMALVLYRLRFAGNRNSVNLDEVSEEDRQPADRRFHKVRLGETLQSIAVHDELMKDVNMWVLICRLNDLDTACDVVGRPRAQINRGDTLLLPNREEVEEFKLLAKLTEIARLSGKQLDIDMTRKPAPAKASPLCRVDRQMSIEKLWDRCRMILTENDDTSYSIKLQRDTLEGRWCTVAAYESKEGKTLRWTYKVDGSRHCLEVGLPAAVSREMAIEDFQRNWRFYYNRYTTIKTDTLELVDLNEVAT